MKSREPFLSASGLRPMSAFVVIGGVILSVACWVSVLAGEPVRRPRPLLRREDPAPAFSVEDAFGRTVAVSVPRFDLEMSPTSMWQAHTPERMATRISAALGGDPGAEELLDRMLPDNEDGVIEVDAWLLGGQEALRVDEWIRSGIGSQPLSLDGIWLSEKRTGARASRRFRLRWMPEILLSQETRAAHGYSSPRRWTRDLARGLSQALAGPGAQQKKSTNEIWKALLPKGFARPVRGLSEGCILELSTLLEDEGVQPWQMTIVQARDRSYPCGSDKLYGSWGCTSPDQYEPAARAGLELLAEQALSRFETSFVQPEPAVYSWLQDRSQRGDRSNGFYSFRPGGTAPAVETSLDLRLQRFVRKQLEALVDVHRPAVAMAIVLDVETGSVLAVDSVEGYEVQPFAPVFHTFTPGSTTKILTMALALEHEHVHPEERFEVGQGRYVLVDPADGRTRDIREAEGSKTGNISAAECLAFSVNAGMVQIGLRIAPEVYRETLVRLGYGVRPQSGLGVEKAGYLPELPWKYRFTHASITFGHELSTNLWQHAQALASVLRGGETRELGLVRSVRSKGVRRLFSPEESERIFSEETCAQVREMMRLSAREGTHKHLWRPDADVGTKTGTAQKVPGEVCLHVELAEREACVREGVPLSRERYRTLRTKAKPHRNCYTASMVAFGRQLEGDRELMVLVVADEPRGKEKYGAKVAGPTTAAILWEALGYTDNGIELVPDAHPGFGRSEWLGRNDSLEPWGERY